MFANWNQPQPAHLVGLAQSHFGQLSPAETTLLLALQLGGLAVCGTSPQLADPSNDPTKANEWGPERIIRADLIRWICVDPRARDSVGPHGIQIIGAVLAGGLELTRITTPFDLRLLACRLTGCITLHSAGLSELDLRRTWVASLNADNLNVARSVWLSHGFRSEGEVRLSVARIGIDLVCENGLFSNSGGVALNVDGATVGRNIFLHKGFHADGQVRALGTRVGGSLECDGGAIGNPATPEAPTSGVSLYADSIIVGGYILMRNGFAAEGAVMLPSAEVGANLECDNASIQNAFNPNLPNSGMALNAEGIHVKGNLLLGHGFRACGEIRIRGANIVGNLNCEGGAFTNPSKMALDADRIKVGGYVFLRNGFTADGEVKLLNAEVGSNFECDAAQIHNPQRPGAAEGGRALNADSIKVKGYVFLRKRFLAQGSVSFLNAQVGCDFECTSGTFRNPTQENRQETGTALCLDGASIKGTVFFTDKFSADGEVQVSRAQIGGHLLCEKANITGLSIAQGSKIGGAFVWKEIVEPQNCSLDLINTSCDALVDDSSSWPGRGKMKLDGLIYERLSSQPTPKSAKARLDWLSRQESFRPQPYRQLAKVLRSHGDNLGARRVLSRMDRLRRNHEYASRSGFVRFWAAIWSAILRGTIGYGFHPARALWWLVGLTLVGTGIFTAAYAAQSIVPSDKEAFQQFRAVRTLPAHYERFNPFIYSLENSFPVIRFGQADHWQPLPGSDWDHLSARIPKPLTSLVAPWWLRRIRWLQISLGWFFTTMGLAAVSGIVRKER